MSLTNRVIIPIVDSRQNLEEQNVFKHSSFTLTPQKNQQPPEVILWKKSMSAFKKFKQKKDRKDKRDELAIDQSENQEPVLPKRFVKLLRKSARSRSDALIGESKDYICLFQEPNLGYFDPNQAPLYMASSNDLSFPPTTKDKKIVLKQQTTICNASEIRLQSVQSQAMEEEYPQVSIEPQPDDPFIIIKKNTSKKSNIMDMQASNHQRLNLLKKIKSIRLDLKTPSIKTTPSLRRKTNPSPLKPPNSNRKTPIASRIAVRKKQQGEPNKFIHSSKLLNRPMNGSQKKQERTQRQRKDSLAKVQVKKQYNKKNKVIELKFLSAFSLNSHQILKNIWITFKRPRSKKFLNEL